MAGMLPGVEAARRRRFHVSNQIPLKRYPFSLYDHHSSSNTTRNPSTWKESMITCDESRLSAAAREAKKRLDERLQLPRTQNKRSNVGSSLKRLSWLKLWKSSEQEECAVCLERLSSGGSLMQLPCAHRFHADCLLPWLEANAHCPCCRLEIPY